MIRFITMSLCLSISLISYGQGKGELPNHLVHIKQLENDPERLIDAARAYQLQQADLVDWDIEQARKHADAQEQTLEQMKSEVANDRMLNMKLVWDYVLAIYPNHPRVLNYYGEFLYDYAGDVMGAVSFWKRASTQDKESGMPDNNLAMYYFHAGNYRLGLASLHRALDADDTNPDFLFNAAQIYLIHFPQLEQILKEKRSSIYKVAMKYSKAACKYAPEDFDIVQDYAVNFFAGERCDVEVNWNEAASAWTDARQLVENENQRFYTLLNEGRCLVNAKRPDHAVERFEEALLILPNSVIAQELIMKTKALGDQ